MFSKLRQLSGQSTIYALGEVLRSGLAFLLLPIYTRLLSPADYGILGVVAPIDALITMLMGLGLHGALLRFYFDYQEEPERLRTYAVSLFLPGRRPLSGQAYRAHSYCHDPRRSGKRRVESLACPQIRYPRCGPQYLFTSLGYLILLSIVFLIGQSLHPLHYEYGRIAQIVVLGLGFFVAGVLFAPDAFWGRVLLKVAILCAFPLSLYLTGFLSTNERRRLRRLWLKA